MASGGTDDEAAPRLEAEGLQFYQIRPGVIRLMTSWQITDADIDQAVSRFAGVLGA